MFFHPIEGKCDFKMKSKLLKKKNFSLKPKNAKMG